MSEEQYISPFGGADKKTLAEDKLLAYLEGKLTPAEQHEVEQILADEGMESDAIDGLVALNAPERKAAVSRLNNTLRHQLGRKKKRRHKAKTDMNAIVALLLILAVVIAAYLVIKYSL